MAAAFFGMLMTGTLLLSGMGMQASAQTIRHEHSGDAQNGGECFSNPVYHAHEGNETEGGSCYSTPVYHVHMFQYLLPPSLRQFMHVSHKS